MNSCINLDRHHRYDRYFWTDAIYILLFIYLLPFDIDFYFLLPICGCRKTNKQEGGAYNCFVPQIKLNAGSESWTGVTIFF